MAKQWDSWVRIETGRYDGGRAVDYSSVGQEVPPRDLRLSPARESTNLPLSPIHRREILVVCAVTAMGTEAEDGRD
ncbi:hypothetical protein FOPE_01921 [Fonsecaea pedrosoi]|nr:hypothetical protein FOPE_01921 [Fonsecaea pedrosoi]